MQGVHPTMTYTASMNRDLQEMLTTLGVHCGTTRAWRPTADIKMLEQLTRCENHLQTWEVLASKDDNGPNNNNRKTPLRALHCSKVAQWTRTVALQV